MKEEWKAVVDYPLYEVSSLGNVRSWKNARHGKANNPKPMKLFKHSKSEHLNICLSKDKKQKWYSVHVLVLESFKGKRPNGKVSRHLDGDAKNNCISNLVWGTQQENMDDRIKHGTTIKGSQTPWAKMNEDKVRELRKLRESGVLLVTLAKKYGINETTAWNINARRTWRHVV